MIFEDELDELTSVEKDLKSLMSIAKMTTSYPAWGGDPDTVRVIACALGSLVDRLQNVNAALRKEYDGASDV
jgi:hypothetical protein